MFRAARWRDKGHLILGTWFGTGWAPVAPGTAGTLGAVPLALGLHLLPWLPRLLCLLGFIVLAVRVSGCCQRLLGRPDPSAVVIDEVAGFCVACLLLAPSWLNYSLAFTLFRFFDILKPYPLRRAERVGGGLGIVLDDLLAGGYAVLILAVTEHLLT